MQSTDSVACQTLTSFLQLAKCDVLESEESDNSARTCALGHSCMIAQGRVSALSLAPRCDGGDVGVRLTCLWGVQVVACNCNVVRV